MDPNPKGHDTTTYLDKGLLEDMAKGMQEKLEYYYPEIKAQIEYLKKGKTQ